MEPVAMLAANYLLFGAVSLVSDQVYRYYKFRGSLDGVTFCFFDNFFYGWYYFICTLFFLPMGCFLIRYQNLSAQNPIWRMIKCVSLFIFLAECEAILQFVYVSRDIEYQVEEISDQQMVYAFVLLGVMRWAISLFGLSHSSMALEAVVHQDYGYSVVGSGFTVNRYRLNIYYGWMSQYITDYVVLHYLAHWALFSPQSPTYSLQSDQFYHYPEQESATKCAINSVLCVLFILFYLKLARKEFTMFNFIM